MSLNPISQIYVLTSNGEKEIELCLGDITKLPIDQKVDVIMVSAFAMDYTPSSISLIGALYRNLRLSVRELAINHVKEDLRRSFNCWLSQPLPDHIPYRQLLCFERPMKTQSIYDCVQGLFRAMMPIFNNENKSVITPLLATGAQNVNKGAMLKMMVTAAVEWMRMGLPLQLLKIVLYVPDPQNIGRDEQDCLKIFEKLKRKIESKKVPPQDYVITNDVFLVWSESEEDQEMVDLVKKELKNSKKITSMKSLADINTPPDRWQHEVFSAMVSSAKVVPLLTSSFMADQYCIDQFNIALCCKRQVGRNILAPLFMDQFDPPLYMSMVQYLNCRPRDESKIHEACRSLVSQISDKDKSISDYDIFISYSHKNLAQAEVFLEAFQATKSDLKIFFDYKDIKTGMEWQEMLYKSIDNSKCVIALISKDYLQSQFCVEEFNLALAQHLAGGLLGSVFKRAIVPQQNVLLVPVYDKKCFVCGGGASCNKFKGKKNTLTLVPICLEEKQTMSAFGFVKPVNAFTANLHERASYVSNSVTDWLQKGKMCGFISKTSDPIDFDTLSSLSRQEAFNDRYDVINGMVTRRQTADDVINDVTADYSIHFSYTISDKKYARFLYSVLQKKYPDVKLAGKLNDPGQMALDMAEPQCTIVLLSANYLRSKKQVEEFNLIIGKQRKGAGQKLMYVITIDKLPRKPTYFRLVPCDTNLNDDFWGQIVDLNGDSESSFNVDPVVMNIRKRVTKECGNITECHVVGLLKACCDLHYLLSNYRGTFSTDRQDTLLQNVVDLHVGLSIEQSNASVFRDSTESHAITPPADQDGFNVDHDKPIQSSMQPSQITEEGADVSNTSQDSTRITADELPSTARKQSRGNSEHFTSTDTKRDSHSMTAKTDEVHQKNSQSETKEKRTKSCSNTTLIFR